MLINTLLVVLGVFASSSFAETSGNRTACESALSSRAVPQVYGGQRLRSIYHDIATIYAKYGITVPEHVLAKTASTTPGAFSAVQRCHNYSNIVNMSNPYSHSNHDVLWLTPVTIGTPPQEFLMDLDTGSSDLWVFSTTNSSLGDAASNHSRYDYTRSVTANESLPNTWNIHYGDGSQARGCVVMDTVSIGHTTIDSQAVELAAVVSSKLLARPADGLVGLGFPARNSVRPNRQLPFWTSAVTEGAFDNVSYCERVFTIRLEHNGPGLFTFGEIDHSQFTGSISYTSVVDLTTRARWYIFVDGYTIDQEKNVTTAVSTIQADQPPIGPRFQVLVDSGSSLLLLPKDLVHNYYSGVNGSVKSFFWEFPCSASLPDLSLFINGTRFVVPGALLNFRPIPEFPGWCSGGLQDSLLEVHAQGAERVGFAKKSEL